MLERLSRVRTCAGRSKKGRNTDGTSGGRLEGRRGGQKAGNAKPNTIPSDKNQGIAKSKEKIAGGENGTGEVPRGKPKSGPKPLERVTQAGQPMLLLNRGDRSIGKEFTPWTSDPTERQPDDYYKYGPFGPHAWKGIVVGNPRKATFADNPVVFFGTVQNEEEHEQISIVDAIIGYEKRVNQLDESVGIQYYFAFVRQVQRVPNQAPWKEWTLVGQVAVESRAELDKWRLGFLLDRSLRENLTRCVAWYRPDLIYIKKPAYQVRFEPQKDFLEVLLQLLNPDNESNSQKSDSYIGKLCQILGVTEKDDVQQVGITFDSLSEEKKMECLEHVLGSHPVELLTPFTRKAREEELIGKGGVGDWNSMQRLDGHEDNEEEEYEEEPGVLEAVNEEDDDDSDPEMEMDFGDGYEERFNSDKEADEQWEGTEWEKEEAKALLAGNVADEDTEWEERVVKAYSELESNSPGDSHLAGEADAEDSKQDSELLLKSAVRPYTYTNLIKEIFIIRQTLVEYPALR